MSQLERGSAHRVTSRPARRSLARPAALAVLAASIGLVTACGSGGSNNAAATSGTPSASAAATTPAATPAATAAATPAATPAATTAAGGSTAPACTSSAISQDTVETAAPQGAAAGTSYYRVIVQNQSHSTCSLTGYLGDVNFLTSPVDGRQLGSPATDQPVNSPETVTLAPGRRAYATLSIKAASSYSASACKPVSTEDLFFGLPGHSSVYGTPLPSEVPICSSSGVGQVGIAALQPGNGARNPEL